MSSLVLVWQVLLLRNGTGHGGLGGLPPGREKEVSTAGWSKEGGLARLALLDWGTRPLVAAVA